VYGIRGLPELSPLFNAQASLEIMKVDLTVIAAHDNKDEPEDLPLCPWH